MKFGNILNLGHVEATAEEAMHGGRRVEAYRCPKCSNMERFPRYNNPGKLLETRRGRCGEWANCFYLIAKAVGFESRFVVDRTDHVWIEFFSKKYNRWIHVDPCECAIDKPLLYESGWGKKLTYVIAMSVEEILDVTWRYSSKHREVWQRRLECRELKLISFLEHLNRRIQATVKIQRNNRHLILKFFLIKKNSCFEKLNNY